MTLMMITPMNLTEEHFAMLSGIKQYQHDHPIPSLWWFPLPPTPPGPWGHSPPWPPPLVAWRQEDAAALEALASAVAGDRGNERRLGAGGAGWRLGRRPKLGMWLEAWKGDKEHSKLFCFCLQGSLEGKFGRGALQTLETLGLEL